MVQVKIFILQGAFKFSPNFTPQQIQQVRSQIQRQIHHLNLFHVVNILELKVYPRKIDDKNELKDEFEYIIGLLKGVNRKVRFTGEMLGYRMNADENAYKKCRWYFRKNDFYLTYEYIDFRIAKKGK